MSGYFRAELLKLMSLPAVHLTAVGTLVLALAGYAQAGFVVLGVVAATSEYGGQIGTTLVALPKRVPLHLVKLVVLGSAAVALAVPAVVVATIGLRDNGFSVGECAYLALTAVLSAAVASVVRRGVPALAGLLGYFFIAGPLLRQAEFARCLPDRAATAAVWVVVSVAISAVTFQRRDA